MRILVSAGEASGETYGAELISAVRTLVPGAEFFGLGGEKMRAAGCDITVDAKEVAVVGLAEVVTHLPKIWGQFRRLVAEAEKLTPDAAVLIDFPDFNFRLAKELHARGIPVFYYVSPQLWAWRPGRVKLVQEYVRKMLVIFPFERDFYARHRVDVEFVGHPMADLRPPVIAREKFAAEYGLDLAKQWIALLPGSRTKEVRMNYPEMLRAAEALGPEFEYVTPVASTLEKAWLASFTVGCDVPIKFSSNSHATLHLARAAVVASGTATVEATLMNVPFVMVYRVSQLTYAIGRPLVRVPHFAMPNLIAGREVVPELVQKDFTAENIVSWMRRLVPAGRERESMLAGLDEIRQRLNSDGQQASHRAAEIILRELGTSSTMASKSV